MNSMYRWSALPVFAFSSLIQLSDALAQANVSHCYGHLTELVRSSNFPFRYVDKSDAHLLIDNDSGDQITAQLFFDTEGSGVIGWVRYFVATRRLMNISADSDEPEPLQFDTAHALAYEQCIAASLR